VDSAEKAEMMRSLGFDHVINYRAEDFTRSTIKYDLIVDARTKRPVRRFLNVLNPGGRYVTVGGDINKLLQLVALKPFISLSTSKTVHMLALKPNKDLSAIEQLHRQGALTPVIDGPHAFEDIPKLIEAFGNATHKGKIVVRLK
jgi:NADPH:quinone reductase-like Zn-dependent oxidoreductase